MRVETGQMVERICSLAEWFSDHVTRLTGSINFHSSFRETAEPRD